MPKNITGIFAMFVLRIHPDTVANPDFIGVAGRTFGVLPHPIHLHLQFGFGPPVIRIQETDPFPPSYLYALIPGGRNTPVVFPAVDPNLGKPIQESGSLIRRPVIHHDQLEIRGTSDPEQTARSLPDTKPC